MNEVTTGATRRPLSAGELLDRSVNVVVRNWLAFGAILAGVFVPLAICETFSSSGAMLRALAVLITAGPQVARNPAVYGTLFDTHPNWFDVAQWAVIVLLLPVGLAAVTIVASRAYDGERTAPLDALRGGLRRYFPIIGLGIVWLVAVTIVFILYILVVTLGATAFLVVLRGAHLQGVAVGLGILIAILTVIVGIAATGILFMVGNVSFAAIVVETANPFYAIGRSFARVFDRREVLRAILVSLALFVLLYILSIFGWLVGSLLFWATHVFGMLVAGAQAGAITGYAFYYTFVAYYYRDVRLRREGTDLFDLAAAPAHASTPA